MMDFKNFLTIDELHRFFSQKTSQKEKREWMKLAKTRSENYPDPDRNYTITRKNAKKN